MVRSRPLYRQPLYRQPLYRQRRSWHGVLHLTLCVVLYVLSQLGALPASANEPVTAQQARTIDKGGLADHYELAPPQARPGECYAKVIVPPVYKETRETVIKREASEVLTVVPATFEWVEESVLVKEAGEKLTVVPETYRWVEEKILVEPAGYRLEPIAPVFETITEQVLDTPEQITWSNECGPLQRAEHMTGDVLCLIAEPATYRTITRHVVSKPAATRRIEVPARYKTIRKQVLDSPARVVREVEPAQYETIRVKKMVSPPRVQRVATPVEYQSVKRKEKIADPHFVWRRTLCESRFNEDEVIELQQALKKFGFDPGDIDGVYGDATRRAVDAFQLKRELPRGALTIETFESLGLRSSGTTG